MSTWLQQRYEQLHAGLESGRHPRWVVEVAHTVAILGKESVRDRLHVRAAMLAYWTCVALVPLMLLGFAMTGPLGLTEETRDAVRTLLYDSILAQSVEDVGGLLDQLLDTTQLKTLGIVGVLGVMFIGSQLFFSTELAYNDIFKTRVRRSWLLRFTLFYAAITLTPMVVATGFIMSSRAGIGGAGSVLNLTAPWLLTTLVLISGIRLLPCKKVGWWAAIAGGVLSASLFESAKLLFGVYTHLVGTAQNMALIYGSVSILPIFLLWIYLVWLLILFGVEIAYLVDNYQPLLERQRRLVSDPNSLDRRADAWLAVTIMVLITRRFLAGDGPMPPSTLAEITGASPAHVDDCLHLLREAELLLHVEHGPYTLAVPPSSIRLSEVVAAWRERTGPNTHEQGQILLDHAFDRIEASSDENLVQAAHSLEGLQEPAPSAPIELNPRGSSHQ
jgi:membrane protein